MSNTLGMPSATPSNATGRSGVGEEQVGHIGNGILGTIEEGVGGTSSRQLYYGTGAAFFQAPSMQRSYGDDIRSFNVKTFGSRGMVNLPRRWLDQGPTEIFFSYPIQYAWAGPEYSLRVVPKTLFQNTTVKYSATYLGTGAAQTFDTTGAAYGQYLGECATEMRSGPNILPTYFWSGGAGFAFPAMIELNMGGGGNIIFDRYTNFAMIMASCPTISMRRDLMRMAGGGLYYDHETDYNLLPVRFGWVPGLTDEGTAVNRNSQNSSAQENGENANLIWAPVEWNISIPLKTPQTNFWNSLLSRKPVDSSCLASDFQYIISLGNFFEFSDTGCGLAHCPYYIPPLGLAASPKCIADDVIQVQPFWHPNQANNSGASVVAGGAGTWTITRNLADGWAVYTKPSGTPLGSTAGTQIGLYGTTQSTGPTHTWPVPCLLPPGYFYTGYSPQLDFNVSAVLAPGTGGTPILSDTIANLIKNTSATPAAAFTVANWGARSRIAANPRIWANHYRVCNGFIYGGVGAPRPRMAVAGSGTAESDNRYKLDAQSVHNGTNQSISYASSFLRMEYRNRSLKLTNPALSARLPLQSTPQACVYYPFSYGFSQTYRIAPASNPWEASNFHRWTSGQGTLVTNAVYSGQTPLTPFSDITQVSNKITQNIIMPANPCTSMIVGIYREKDRKFLGVNSQGTYSPVLFWNALNPARCTLYDGGNILFDYTSSMNYEFGSIVDRPDVFRIPFRGGLCQLDPKNILSGPFDCLANVSLGDSTPNGFNQSSGVPRRFTYNQFGGGSQHGDRFHPLHCTEWYNCHLLEFPFCMHEPLGREGTVQSTPSFAKTILRLEFYIDALLKPPRGLDDMYDQTTVVPTAWFSGEWDYSTAGNAAYAYSAASASAGAVLPFGPLSFNSTNTVATANVALSVPCAYILDSPMNFNIYSDDRESQVQILSGGTTRTASKTTNPYFTMSPSASSWNVNDGGLMVQVNFLQNQVWVISPLRTSILSSRG